MRQIVLAKSTYCMFTLFPVLPQNHVFFSTLRLGYLATYLVTHVLCGVQFPAEQKPRNNPSIRTVSEVLWNVTVTPWVHSEVWCLVPDCGVTLLAFKKCLFVVGLFLSFANTCGGLRLQPQN